MKVVLVCAISLDGYIAHHEVEQVSWTSKQDKEWVKQRTLEAGVVIMGHNTFKAFANQSQPMPGRLVVVMTRRAETMTDTKHVLFRGGDPRPVLDELNERGYREVILFGGSRVNASLLEATVDHPHATCFRHRHQPVCYSS